MSISESQIESGALLSRFNEMRPLLLAVANQQLCRQLQSKVGASDLVQQTMMDAYLHAHTFQPADDRHIFNWLSKILLNNLRDVSRSFRNAKKRSLRLEQRLISDATIVDSKNAPRSLELQEDLDLLSEALNCLPRAHHQILTWRYHEQMSFSEIAELVDRSEDAVRMLVKRAIHRLAREMKVHDNSTTC
jgi:RNA polymerase sigma-70 factor, ECF subfamily